MAVKVRPDLGRRDHAISAFRIVGPLDEEEVLSEVEGDLALVPLTINWPNRLHCVADLRALRLETDG
jgi:hypothetical protein